MLIIRADGNARIGAGHLMRCLTIAEAVRERGDVILFLCADEDSAKFAEDYGYSAEALHTDPARMEDELPGWEALAQVSSGNVQEEVQPENVPGEVQSASDGIAANTILVDSYYVTAPYLLALKKYGKVFLMDDMQSVAYPVDAVINYNLFADRERYHSIYRQGVWNGESGGASASDIVGSAKESMPEPCCGDGREPRFYLGAEYVPLREQFRRVDYSVRDRVDNVLLTTGGGDADNIAGAIFDLLYRPDIHYHVLVGRFSPHFEDWQRRAGEVENLQIYHDVKDMAGLMCRCDLAVSAGGSTLYELAAVGLPFICFSYAENQEALAEYMGQSEAAICAGAWHQDREAVKKTLRHFFDRLCGDVTLRRQFSARERKLIDGEGARRLAAVLTGGELSGGWRRC